MRVLVIVNTRAGGGDAGLYDYVRVLGSLGAEITLRFCDGEKALEELALDAARFDRVVAAGGDGTASAVCYALRNSHVPILVYPAGTANLLAQNLNMPLEPRQLAHTTIRGRVVDFDLGEIERPTALGPSCSGFIIMSGAGLDAALVTAAQPLKSNLGEAAYFFAAVSNLAPQTAVFELELDGETVRTTGIGVLIVNFGRLQFDVPVSANADPRDGVFDVAVIRTRTAVGLVPAFVASISGAQKLPGIDVYEASRVSIVADPELAVQYDGELAGFTTPFNARVLPHATSLLLPHDSEFAR